MPVEELIEKIEEQRKVILEALREQRTLLDSLKNAGRESYDWISIKQAAELLGVSLSTIYWKINHDDLSVKHIRSRKFVKRAEVVAMDDKYEG